MLRKIFLVFITILTFISSLLSLDFKYNPSVGLYNIRISKKGWHQAAFTIEKIGYCAATIWEWKNGKWRVWVNPNSKYDKLRDYVNNLGIGKEYNKNDIIVGWAYLPEDPDQPIDINYYDPTQNDFSFNGWKMTTAPNIDLEYFNTTYDIVSIWSWDENHWLVYSPVPKIQKLLDKYNIKKLDKIYGSQGIWIYKDPSIYCSFGALDPSQMAFKQFITELAKSNPALYIYDNGTFGNLKKFMCEHMQEFQGLSKEEFIDKIYDMFSFLNDEHLMVGNKRLVSKTWNYYTKLNTFNSDIVNEYLQGELSDDYVTITYIKGSKILYVRVSSFNFSKYSNTQIYQKYIQVRNYLGQVDAIIFDFRGNRGGYNFSAFDSLVNDQTLLNSLNFSFSNFPDNTPYLTGSCFTTGRFKSYKKSISTVNVSNIIFLVDYKTASAAELVPVAVRTFIPEKVVIIGTDTSWKNFDLDHYVPQLDNVSMDSCIRSSATIKGKYKVTLANNVTFVNYGGYTKFIKDNKTYNILWNGVIPDIKLNYDEIKEYMEQGKDLFIEKALEYLEQKGVTSLGESNDVLDIDLNLSNITKYDVTPPGILIFDNITKYISN